MNGSIRKRGDDAWQLRVCVGWDEARGKYRYATKTFRGNKRDAERALAAFSLGVSERSPSANEVTVGALCEAWFAHASPGWSPTVGPNYRQILDRRVLPRWGETQLHQLRSDALDQWYAVLAKSGGKGGRPLAAQTVVNIHAVLRRALGRACGGVGLSRTLRRTLRPPEDERNQSHRQHRQISSTSWSARQR